MAVAAAPLPPPAIVSPAPREVSYGRIEGRAPSGTRQVLVRVGGRLLATKAVTRRRFVVVVPLPSRDVTVRVTAVDALGRRSSSLVGPVYGLPRAAAPYAGPIPSLRGYEDAALASATRALARRFPGSAASSSRTSGPAPAPPGTPVPGSPPPRRSSSRSRSS